VPGVSGTADNANYVSAEIGGISGVLAVKGTAATDSPTLGAELLSAPNTPVNWTGSGLTWSLTAGFTEVLTFPVAAVVNNKYQITYTITSSAGSVTVAFGGQSIAGLTASGSFGPTATTTGQCTITPLATFVGTITIGIKQITAVSTPLIGLKSADGVVRYEQRTTPGANMFLGFGAGRYNTTGSSNTGSGYSALFSNTTGSSNTGSGYNALYSNTTGGFNAGSGYNALFSNTTGSSNTGSGYGALYSSTTGSGNTGSGYGALFSNTTGSSNTGSGYNALYSSTTGGGNTGSGASAGRYLADGVTANATPSNCTYVGYNTKASVAGATNEAVFGYNAIGSGSNTVTLGAVATVGTVSFGVAYKSSPAPSAINASATLTAAQLLTGIVTTTSAVAVAFTLPTGTLTDAAVPLGLAINTAFDWSLINLGSASGAITVSSGATNTLVGNATVAIGTTAGFRTQKTAANTYTTYRTA